MNLNQNPHFRAKTLNEMETTSDWDIAFKIGDVWEKAEELDIEDPDEFDQFKILMMPKLRRFSKKIHLFLENREEELDILEEIIQNLDDSRDADEWNYSWKDFYDWADDNRIWIALDEIPDYDENGEEKNIEDL